LKATAPVQSNHLSHTSYSHPSSPSPNSGKSSFINYVAGRKIQTAGVAPTDDTFTIIVPGPADVDRDGPAFIGDPDMGFGGLKTFGPQLIHHTQLKVRSNLAINDFMVVDTPGMFLRLLCLG